jgi:hypothetical protein
LNAHLTTERFVEVIVTVDGRNFCKTIEIFGGFLVRRLEVLAVAAPRGIELENLYSVSWLSKVPRPPTEV